MSTVMNNDAFWSRVEEDAALARELINLFFTETPKILSDLRVAVFAHDHDGVKRAAHAMRGMVANFSASPAVDAAGVLEEMGRSGDLAKVEEAFVILDHQLVHLRSALAHFEEGIIA